jgi:hypothetical protein
MKAQYNDRVGGSTQNRKKSKEAGMTGEKAVGNKKASPGNPWGGFKRFGDYTGY